MYVQQEQPWRRPLTAVLAVLVGLWTAGASVATATAGWIAAETRLELYSRPLAAWAWLVVAGAGTVLAGLPALLLALVPRAQPARVAGRTWALAALLSGVLGAARATVSWPHHELYLALLAVLAGAGWVLLRRFHRGGPAPAHVDCPPGRIFAALAGGLAVLLPWLWAGALGGVVETLAAVLAAAAAGALAAALVTPLWTVYGTGSRWWRIGAGGLVAGTALAALAAGTGRAGTAVALLYVLSPLGFAAATLPRWRALLFGLAAVGPFAFVDPDELTLVLGLREVPFWALLATVCSLVIGLLVGLWWAVGRPGRRFAAVAAVLALAAAATVHIGLGQPGSTGDRLFVVMRATADLSTVDGDRTVRLHETYRRLTGTARASQAPLRRELDRLHLHYTPYYLVNGIEVDAGDWLRPRLAGRTDVARVLLSPRLRPIPAPAPGLRGNRPAPDSPQWNITMVEADRVRSTLGVTGAGIVVGTSESGVDGDHPAVRDNFRGGDDSWYDPWNRTRRPTDHGGHGTHTLATAIGHDNVGVAPGAQWVGCVNLDRNLGNTAHYLDCLQFMLAPFPYGGDPWRDGRPDRAPDVLTNSWGCPPVEGCDLGTLRAAVDALTGAGIYVVVAAGNSGPACRTVDDPPAPYPSALTVGAVDQRGNVAEFSSRGPTPDGRPKPDLLAPGVGVLSALPGGRFGALDGTSMAAPHVAGVVALMWSANPALVGDIARTTEILRRTARPLGVPVPCGGAGAGIVDAIAAVRAARG